MPPGSLAIGGIALKIPGGKFSWVSQLVSTRRPIRSRVAGDQHLRHRAAGVVADDRHVLEVERLEEAVDDRGDAGRGEVGVGVHRDLLGADRPVGRDAAAAIGEPVDDAVPEAAVDEEAVDEDDRLALARFAVADAPRGQLDLVALAAGHRSLMANCSVPPQLGNLMQSEVRRGKIHTDSMNVKRDTGASARRRPGRGADRRRAAALRRARLRRRRHRGDRPRGGGHPRRALPPLRRQARALRGRLRADRGRAGRADRRRRPAGQRHLAAGGDAGRRRDVPRAPAPSRRRSGSSCSTAPRCWAGTAGARSPPSTASA